VAINTKLRFGIVQGRLIQPPTGQLQWFPQDDWQSEFFISAACGIDYIELIAERDHNPSNPLWTDEGVARIKELVKRNNLSLHALCNDYIIDHALPGSSKVLEQNFQLLEWGRLLGCEKYVLPLFEHSELTAENTAAYIGPLRAIADRAAACGMLVCIETALDGKQLLTLMDRIDHPAVAVVYDTGNRVAFGHDLPADIRLLGAHVRHVHIKDKNAENHNVLLGTGLVNFQAVFEALVDIGYEGPYTFETQRGRDPARTARYNMDVVEFFYREALDR
jgi:sugar phosphate isomerase/epimerase